jgi:hypothetical protein
MPEFAIVHAVLTLIHKRESKAVSVKELTKAVNVVLHANGEWLAFTPAEIGYRLAALGLFTRRSSAGKELRLDRDASRLVHALARKYGVPMPTGGFPGYPDCEQSPDVSENQRLLQGVHTL